MILLRISCVNCPHECEDSEKSQWLKYFDPCSLKNQIICEHDIIMELDNIEKVTIENYTLYHGFYKCFD